MDVMDISDGEDDEIFSDSDTWIYCDEDIQPLDEDINENNWRFVFQETLNNIRENKLDDGAQPLIFDGTCKIRIKKFPNAPFTFPLSNALCSRLISEHGTPMALANRYDFCGLKVPNTGWKVNPENFDFPIPLSAAIRSYTFEQLHLNTPDLSEHFDLNLHKLFIFGPCTHSKIYNFDDKLFVYLATVLVFLPSHYTGGNYRFIDDNDDNEDLHRHFFNQQELDNKSKPYILIVPPDCQHEIQPLEKGFKLLLVYHLVSNTNSIQQLISLLSKPKNHSQTMENIFLSQRLQRIFTYWETNLDKMPTKLVIPIQHSLDYSSYFSILFRDRYRTIIEILTRAIQQFSSFLVYSATLQHEAPFGDRTDSRLVVHSLTMLNTVNQIALRFDSDHERTIVPNEVLGELHMYIDSFEQAGGRQQVLSNGITVFRHYSKFQVLLIIPLVHQWDLLLDDHAFACHHLSYMLSLPTNALDSLSLNLLSCILREKTASSNLLFGQIIHYLIILRTRLGLTPNVIQLIKLLFRHKQFQDELFSNEKLFHWLNRLVASVESWSMFAMEFLELFRKVINSSMPTKLNEVIQFLLQLSNAVLRALFINTLLRTIFKRRTLPRHVLLSTLCSILHLLIVDGSYSLDCQLSLAYNIIKRVRKTSIDGEIIEKCFKIHLIPMLINIYRDLKIKGKQSHSVIPLSAAFILIYEYCLNALNYYCSSNSLSSSPLNVVSINEALLICPCASCTRLQMFLVDSKTSTLILGVSSNLVADHCLRHTLSKFPMLSIEYKHDSCTGREETLIISKCGYEEEQKQLCFHLRRLLLQLHRL
ncbi:unnamed protein product [Adineta ricciae]|uniref:Prolyl 4-hydroxylase alpha subunit Fe(2+) 2OG dioxygenase domain-containing protein n=2 Tax=Adineta ricciae TaxID=249248 RepID=A0A814FZ20_ADIRI|nr:unnamed protein product [Adineta ricciae]